MYKSNHVIKISPSLKTELDDDSRDNFARYINQSLGIMEYIYIDLIARIRIFGKRIYWDMKL